MKKILIIDDDIRIIDSISSVLNSEEYSFSSDTTGKKSIEIIKNEEIDLVLLDVNLGEVNGIELLKKIREKYPDKNVIMISGESDIEIAVKSIHLGAFNFLEKPFSRVKLRLTIENALTDYKNRRENFLLKNEILRSYTFTGESSKIKNVDTLIGRAAASNIAVLITGENGTGKEIAARRLHYLSNRAAMPFVSLNCASIPKDLLESELFGYRKGSFTGAVRDREGIFESAEGSSIFLDEIGDMPQELQSKLLRALEEKEIKRIGDTAPIKIDVRIISATNRNLSELIKSGGFREDLFYRLNGLNITVPPLRERKGDILALVKRFIENYCYENNMPVIGIDEVAIKGLLEYDFPGNIRELKNIVERTILLTDENPIQKFYIPVQTPGAISDKKSIDTSLGELHEVKRQLLQNYLKGRLEKLNNDKKNLADELGIHPNNLYRLLKD